MTTAQRPALFAADAESAVDVVLYDGVCGLCDRFVQFVLARDEAGRFRFAALQSAFARERLAALGRSAAALDTVYVLTADGRLLDRTTAVIRVVSRLPGAWHLVAAASLLPRPLRDALYRALARVRHRLFARLAACRLPSPQNRARFIEDAPDRPAPEPPQTSAGETGR